METTGGGWTVLLARKKQEDRVNFRQDWNAYKRGFGSAVGEFWLGKMADGSFSSFHYYITISGTIPFTRPCVVHCSIISYLMYVANIN